MGSANLNAYKICRAALSRGRLPGKLTRKYRSPPGPLVIRLSKTNGSTWAIPITLHGSLDTCVSAPLLSPSRHSPFRPLSFHPASSSKRTTNTERERERVREREGKSEERRERRTHERSHPLWPCTLFLRPYLSIYARNGAQSVYSVRYGKRLRV